MESDMARHHKNSSTAEHINSVGVKRCAVGVGFAPSAFLSRSFANSSICVDNHSRLHRNNLNGAPSAKSAFGLKSSEVIPPKEDLCFDFGSDQTRKNVVQRYRKKRQIRNHQLYKLLPSWQLARAQTNLITSPI